MSYSTQYVPQAMIDEMRGSHELGIFVRVDTDPGLKMYFGVNDIPVGFDSIDPNGTVYLGGGRLLGIPSLEVLINGTSDAVDFTVSGIDPATGARMLDSIPSLRGKTVQIGITTLSSYYQPLTNIIPIWTGIASHPWEEKAPVEAGDTASLTLALSVVTGENMRSRAARVLWTDAMQKAISPTDDFCKQVSRIARGVQPTWPRYN